MGRTWRDELHAVMREAGDDGPVICVKPRDEALDASDGLEASIVAYTPTHVYVAWFDGEFGGCFAGVERNP